MTLAGSGTVTDPGDSPATRKPLLKARHLKGRSCTDPAVLQLEWERLFLPAWLCAGRVDEVGEPGDYGTFDMMQSLRKGDSVPGRTGPLGCRYRKNH
jgi:hypothetical protein